MAIQALPRHGESSTRNPVVTLRQIIATVLAGLVLGACAPLPASPPPQLAKRAPAVWHQPAAGQLTREFGEATLYRNVQLRRLVDQATTANPALNAQRLRLEALRHEISNIAADLYPSADLTLETSRSARRAADTATLFNTNIQPQLNLNWNLDLWGQLSNAQQAAMLDYLAERASLRHAKNTLAAQVGSLYWEIAAQDQRVDVAERRLDNAQQSHDIVARGYALGINAALDLYLARNELETQRAAVQQERQRQMERVVELQTILGQPPSGALAVTPTLPEWDSQPEILQPVSALNHRADIEQAWLQWIAGDARRAAAYKARLPQLQLSANLGYSDNSISDLLEGGLWSLAANFSQPLFNAGQLRARYQRTQVQMQALQQDYLAAVDRALGEVEIALSRAEKLQASLGALEKAEHSAAEALKLSITLYERGLVSYTTVLESQQRAFDSALTTIDARNTIAQNRVALYLALGGQFYSSATQLTL